MKMRIKTPKENLMEMLSRDDIEVLEVNITEHNDTFRGPDGTLRINRSGMATMKALIQRKSKVVEVRDLEDEVRIAPGFFPIE